MAMNMLGNGLFNAEHYEDALTVMEAELATRRRLGDSEDNFLSVQSNLANTYAALGQTDKAMRIERDLYSRLLKLYGEEDEETILAAINYAVSLVNLGRFVETKSLLRRTLPVARRVLGQDDHLTLRMRWAYAEALYRDAGATLGDLREAVTTLEDTERIARRVMGGAHPLARDIESTLQNAREALAARDEA